MKRIHQRDMTGLLPLYSVPHVHFTTLKRQGWVEG